MSCSFKGVYQGVFQTYPFNNTASIRFWHLRSARFGHTNDIQYLISGSKSQGEDYLRGLLASSILIFCLAVAWYIFLVACKWAGPRRVGCLSGRHIPLPPNPDTLNEDKDNPRDICSGDVDGTENKPTEASTAWQKKYNAIIRTRMIMKAFVIVAGLSIVISAIMLSVKGVNDLLSTLNGIDYVINYATQLMEEGVTLIDSILYAEAQLDNETTAVLDAVNGICPEILQPICTNITDVTTCNFDAVMENNTAVVEFLTLLEATRSDIYHQLNKSRNDLLDSIAFANSIIDISQTFHWAFWCSLVFSLATAVASLFFVYRAIRLPTKRSRWSFRNVFVLPCFVLLVFLSWIFAMVFVIGSIGLADMCYGSPDDNFKALLARMQNDFSPLIYQSIVYYVSGCPVGQAVQEIVDFAKYLVFFFETAAAAVQSIDFHNVADACGNQSIAKALDATHYVSASICELSVLMEDIHVYLECANWYPLYEEGVYVAVCNEATSGFGWVTATQIAIVVCSMVILSFRVVFHEIDMDVAPTAKEIMEDGAIGTVAPDDTHANNDKEQAMVAVIVDDEDQLEGKDDTQVLESAFVSDKLGDDASEDKTWPVDDCETREVDTGDGALISDPTDSDQDRRIFIEDEKVFAADEKGMESDEVDDPWDDSEADIQKQVVLDSVGTSDAVVVDGAEPAESEEDAGKEVVVDSMSVLATGDHDEVDDVPPIVEESSTHDVDHDNVVILPDSTENEENVVGDDNVVECDEAADTMEESEEDAGKEVVVDSMSVLATGDHDDVDDVTPIVEESSTHDVDHDNVVILPGSTENEENVVDDGNVVECDEPAESEEDAGKEVVVDSMSVLATGDHDEADDVTPIVEESTTQDVDPENVVILPDSTENDGNVVTVSDDPTVEGDELADTNKYLEAEVGKEVVGESVLSLASVDHDENVISDKNIAGETDSTDIEPAESAVQMDVREADVGKGVAEDRVFASGKIDNDDTEGISSIVEEDKSEVINQVEDTIRPPFTTNLGEELVSGDNVIEDYSKDVESNEAGTPEEESRGDMERLPLYKHHESEGASSIIENDNIQDVDQPNAIALPDSSEFDKDANLATIHDQGDTSDEEGETIEDSVEQDLVEDLSESAKNIHGEKDFASWIADNVETYPVDKNNAVVHPDLLTTKEDTKAIAADEIWLWQTKGLPQATNNASSDEEEL